MAFFKLHESRILFLNTFLATGLLQHKYGLACTPRLLLRMSPMEGTHCGPYAWATSLGGEDRTRVKRGRRSPTTALHCRPGQEQGTGRPIGPLKSYELLEPSML
ncbi:hypothetical protein OE88DRAFT_253187 [Heliocybe sulcata]|uniref:Uncharacterized protein n=1 Tax=Heliocybe sulcata TaxID=5364 RepID=A0A5C3MZF2_9AGAM|nr:hypothetical protein OE88DRAFT_253187 [Heliocybe sulcata]